MSGRKCVNCRHYEPSPIWRSGWCRNPRLYTPQESHLVSQDGMECAHRVGNYWEPIETPDSDALPDAAGGRSRVSPLRLFGPQPRLLAATASGGGGTGGGTGGGQPPRPGAGSGGGGYDPSSGSGQGGRGGLRGGDPGPGRTFRDTVGAPQGYAGPDRPVQPGSSPGQERPVSYQPEERYWTDYLRIALPVVGLLLMLGLFWFWAASLIGDEDDDDPNNLAAVATATAPAPSPSPSPPPATETTDNQGGETTGDDTQPAADNGNDETNTADDNASNDQSNTADDETAGNQASDDEGNGNADEPCDTDLCPGDSVVTNSDSVRFRAEASAADDVEIIDTVPEGTEFIVLEGEQVDDGDFVWIPVEDLDGQEGYIASELLTAE